MRSGRILGWMEVVTRRASGTTKFLVRNENVPLVDPGDVNPDTLTIPASLMMNKDPYELNMITTPAKLTGPPPFEAKQVRIILSSLHHKFLIIRIEWGTSRDL